MTFLTMIYLFWHQRATRYQVGASLNQRESFHELVPGYISGHQRAEIENEAHPATCFLLTGSLIGL